MKPYFLSICAVVKNEFPYILEFLAFHKLQGVEHFYLYDNGSTDGTFQILEELAIKKWITLRDWRAVNPIQLRAYNDCLNMYTAESEWIAFIDVDEFLYSRTFPTLKEFIKSMVFFSGYNIGAIAAHWFLFGSNYYEEKTNGLVIERFTQREPNMNLHVKSIVNTDAAISTGKDPHTFYFKDNFVAINDGGVALPKDYPLTSNSCANNLRINHYHTKSKAEYLIRKKLGDPQTMVIDTPERLEERFLAHDRNEVEDTYLRDKYREKVKELIEKELS